MASWRDSGSDNTFVRGLIWEYLPEYRPAVLALEQEEAPYAVASGADDVNMHFVISDIFVGEVFDQLFEKGGPELDAALARRCSAVIEELLGSARPDVLHLTSLRVTDYLLGFIQPWLRFKPYAGPCLLREVDERKRYYTGPF